MILCGCNCLLYLVVFFVVFYLLFFTFCIFGFTLFFCCFTVASSKGLLCLSGNREVGKCDDDNQWNGRPVLIVREKQTVAKTRPDGARCVPYVAVSLTGLYSVSVRR